MFWEVVASKIPRKIYTLQLYFSRNEGLPPTTKTELYRGKSLLKIFRKHIFLNNLAGLFLKRKFNIRKLKKDAQ